ncbi:MAG: protein translocase subunit SecD [Pseudomonadota bacterium]
MSHRTRTIIAVVLCLFGLAYASPNLFPRQPGPPPEGITAYLPVHPLTLGLDLQGGSHLLLEIDAQTVIAERLDDLDLDLRRAFREARIEFARMGILGQSLRGEITNPEQLETAEEILSDIAHDRLTFTLEDTGTFTIDYTDAGLLALRSDILSQSIEVVRRRIDALGTNEPVIQQQGQDRIIVQLPGEDDPVRVRRLLGETAKLTYHMVHQTLRRPSEGRGYLVLPDRDVDSEGNPVAWYALERRVVVSGENLTNAQPSFDNNGQPAVTLAFDSVGTRRFGETTANNVGRQLAIVLDREVLVAPVINVPILEGNAIISGGGFTVSSANELSILLRAGALPAPMKIIEERSVGPKLGADSIRAGQMASIIALLAVVVFMILRYRLYGVIATVSLLMSLVLVVAILSVLGSTLTLPGIAGIVLTVGMAVDANILIFSRIREESRRGLSTVAAVHEGYKNALTTIIDSNLTTLIGALILFYFGSGAIRGFAVTLSVGVVCSMVTAIMVTRLLLVALEQRRRHA